MKKKGNREVTLQQFVRKAIAIYNEELLEGEEPITESEMTGIVEEKLGIR